MGTHYGHINRLADNRMNRMFHNLKFNFNLELQSHDDDDDDNGNDIRGIHISHHRRTQKM